MRFMSIVKGPENAGPPPQPLMDAIMTLTQESMSKGIMVQTGGLLPSAAGARVRLAKGKTIVTDGPFIETKEVFGGYAVFELNSKQEAIELALAFMDLHKQHWPGWEGECEIRQMFDAPESCRPAM